jgi:hypothetical protein
MAHRDDVDRAGIEARGAQRAHDPRALIAPHRPALVVDPLADPGLDEDATRGGFDQEAVQRLEEPVLGIELRRDPALPEELGHGPEERPGVRTERARLDEGDADTAIEVAPPVDGVVQPRGVGSLASLPFAKSRWNADAVGSDWPWYFEPSDGDPYGRSTGLDILKKEIWPIFIPK